MSDTQRDREERQHVIEVLQNMVDWMQEINYIVATPERRHALDYAIASIKTDLKYDLLYEETSEQADKPTTKNNLGVDAISRVEVIDYLCKHCPDDGECFKDCDEIKHLRQMPPVTPQEPKGRWIGHREHCENLGVMPSGLGAYEWCSNCDCGIDVREWHRNHYNYCPNCGARMIEPQESEAEDGNN